MLKIFAFEELMEKEKSERNSSRRKNLKMTDMAKHEWRKCVYTPCDDPRKRIFSKIPSKEIHAKPRCKKRK